MGAFKIDQYGGMLPAWDENLLPPGQAAFSRNSYLLSGALTGWRRPSILRDLTNNTSAFVYRVPTITQATATVQLVFFDNANEGDTFKVGQETYTITATVTDAYDVLLGASADETASNAFAALTLDEGASTGVGTIYGTGTCPNVAISQVPGQNAKDSQDIDGTPYPRIFLRAPDFGTAFNQTVVAESTGRDRLVWLTALDFSAITDTFTGGANQVFDNEITAPSKWLEFLDPDTSVMRSAVVDDSFQRYYFSSPSLPPKYNTYDRIQADSPAFLLGLNPPGCAPGVAVNGGGDLEQMGFPATTSVGPVALPIGANTVYLVQITPDAAMELDDVTFMPAATDLTANFAAVLYDDQGGAPFQLLNAGNVVTGVTAGTPATSQIVNPTGLLRGVKYWIGVMTDTILTINKASDTATDGYTFNQTFTNGPALFAPAGTSGLPTLQIWGDLTTGSVLASRAYVYTWLSAYGEESAPSPYTLINGWSNGTWTIDLFTPPPDDMGVVRNITKKRLYRTITATGGNATYFFVAEMPVEQNVYTDTATDDIVALNRIMPSTTWTPPPEGLQGIVSMPNGMAVGHRANEVWFCQPYQPHAWPAAYVVTTEFPIVGLGVTGNAVVIATSGTPYVATGVNPGAMTLTKTLIPEPCICRGSILSGSDEGVYYVSPNGLVLVTQYGKVTNTTDLWVTRPNWKALTPGKNLRAILMSSEYFAFGTKNGDDVSVAQKGFTIELSAGDAQSFSIWPQPGGHRVGFNTLSAYYDGIDIVNVQIDPWTGIGMLIMDGSVYYYDFADTNPTIQVYKWRSKVYQDKNSKNYEAMRLFFKTPPSTPTQNPTRLENDTDDAVWNTLPSDRYGYIRVFASDENGDMQLVTVREIRRSGEIMRILDGFRADKWQWEIEARVEVSNLQVATSVKELGTV